VVLKAQMSGWQPARKVAPVSVQVSGGAPTPYCASTDSSADERGNSTLMVRNLPPKASILQVFEHLDYFGFAGQYDYVHFLGNSKRKAHRDYAFVVFASEEQCSRCAAALAGTQLHHFETNKAIVTQLADCQGVLANLRGRQDNYLSGCRENEYVPWLRIGGKMVPYY